jgi:glycosyltransferase involved in cell wall biosynthesis
MIISGQSGIGFDDRLNLLSFPDCFVALTDFALLESKKRNPFVKVVKIPNGVDLEKFDLIKNNDGNKSKQNIILSVGAFTKDKRHDLTIRAVSILNNIKLIIAGGGGNLKQEIQQMGENLLGTNKFEIVSVGHDKMPGYYKKVNLFTFPTGPWESFGIVLLEAMASGLPVVTTDDPIRREIVGDAGLFIDPTNTDEYAEAIEKALNTNWDEKPRKQAEKFSWDRIAEEYEKLFKKL